MKNNYYPSGFPWTGKHHLRHTSTLLNRLSKQLLPKESSFQKMMSSIVVFIALGLSFNSYAQVGTIQIGSGTATASGSSAMPVTNYDFTYSQQIVTAADYAMGGGAAGPITKIRYKFTSIGTPSDWDNWTVYIGNTTKTEFTSNTDWVPLAQLTPVFTGTVVAVANNWFEITFSAPFNYTGGNLVVAVDENSLGWIGSPQILSYTSSANAGIVLRDDGAANNPDPASPASATTRVSLVPQLQFVGTQATCPPPTDLNLAALTDNSASFAWLEAGTSTNWDVEFGPAGFTPSGTATDVGVSNPFVKTGLTANTSYQYYVKSVCGPADESAWVGPFSFTTPCVAATVPFFEGFETGYTHNTAVGVCWSQEQPVGTKKWTVNNTFTTYNRTPRTGSWDAFLGWGGNSWMYQGVNLDAGTSYLIKFYARQDENNPSEASVSAHFGLAPNAAAMTNVAIPTSSVINGNYQEFVGYYTPTTTGVHFLGIHGIKTSADYYLTIDDISVEVAPACAAPTSLSATATATTASLLWVENGIVSDWDIEYGPAGFTPTGTPTSSVTTNPTTISGLTPFTVYEYYVRSVCGPADESTWSGPFAFTTACVIADIPFFEGFENGYTAEQNIAGCWTQESFGSTKWVANDSYTTYNRAPRTGSWDATLEYDGESWLFRPMNLVAGTVYMVKFYARQDFNAPGSAVIKSSFGLAPDDASMTSVVVAPTDLTLGNYQEFIGYFTPATSDVYYLGIHATVDFSPWYATLDDISVEIAPTCPAPTALTVSGESTTTATLAWTENGSSSDWDIEYGPLGFTPTGVPTISVTTNPTTITGLTDNTEYSYYVRSNCGVSDNSAWSGPYSFATLCAPISAIGFCEDFEDTSTTLGCWSAINANGDSEEWSIYLDPLYSNSGTRMAGLYTDGNFGANDDYLITPNITLTGNEVIKFAYRVMDATEPNDFQVLLSTTGRSIADFTDTIMHLGSYSNVVYKDTSLDLSAYTGDVYIAFHVPPGGLDGYYLFIDDVCFDICLPTPGVAGTAEVCVSDQTLDLNTVITQGETNGVWYSTTNQAAITGSDLTLGALPYGTSTFNYLVTTGCTVDTTTATITIVAPSSAGNDGSLAVCRNEPFNLLAGLSGNADMGGTWTDPNAVVVPNGNAVSGNIPGQYNFRYIVSNGVCPADTAKVVVNVQGCDFTVGVEDVVFEEFKMYPNPTSDIVFISNAGSTEVFNYEVLDMNGRVILKANNAINGNATTEINLNTVEVGVYMVRVFNEQAEKTFRIVKN